MAVSRWKFSTSKNIGNGMNDARFSLPEFDRLFEQARVLPDSPERTRLYEKMYGRGNYSRPGSATGACAQPVIGLQPDPSIPNRGSIDTDGARK